jgi:hypothetical protein
VRYDPPHFTPLPPPSDASAWLCLAARFACWAYPVQGRNATGPRAGQRLLRLGDRIDVEDVGPLPARSARASEASASTRTLASTKAGAEGTEIEGCARA